MARSRNTRPQAAVPPREEEAVCVQPETAERILSAALECFADHGFEGAKTRDIAERAGVNLGLLKYYYGSKEELWRAGVDRAFTSLLETVATISPDIEDAAQLRNVLDTVARFAAHNANFIRLMNDEGKREGPRTDWLVERHGKPLYELASGILETARARGLTPDVPLLHLYYMFLGATVMLFSQAPECRRLTGVDPTTSEQVIDAHVDALAKLFIRPAL